MITSHEPPSSTSMCCLLWCFYWLKIRVLKDCWRLAALVFWSADTSAFSLVQRRYMICWCGIDAAFCCNPYPLCITGDSGDFVNTQFQHRPHMKLHVYGCLPHFVSSQTTVLHNAVYHLNRMLPDADLLCSDVQIFTIMLSLLVFIIHESKYLIYLLRTLVASNTSLGIWAPCIAFFHSKASMQLLTL